MPDQASLAQQRYLQAKVSGLDVELFPIELEVNEHINAPFACKLKLLAQTGLVDHHTFLGQMIDISIGQDSIPRRFNGLICAAQKSTLNDRDHQVFNLKIVPWFYYLGLGANCRIFQNQSVVDIFKTVCQQYGYNDYDLSSLSGNYPPLPYCTQFNESDADFIERLCQQAGISYTFQHQSGKHTMVLFDQLAAQPRCCDNAIFNTQLKGESALTAWCNQACWHTTKATLRDYHAASAPSVLEAASVSSGNFTLFGIDTFEHFDYPGRFTTSRDGVALSNRYIAHQESSSHLITGTGNYLSFLPGNHFQLRQHPQPARQGQYFLTAITHHAHDYSGLPFAHETPAGKATQAYHNDFTCFSSLESYAPDQRTPWPMIKGPQTATVVGVTEQTAYPEAYAQIKVQFHWDRDGQYTPQSSCWIRVGHDYAGPHHGMQFIPRVGSEVLIDFVDGNPDRPEIAGMLPNANNKLPFDTTKQPNVSGIKTRSAGSADPSAGHEFSFNDTKGQELITLHAHNAMNISSKGDDTSTIGGSLGHSVQGDHTIASHDSLLFSAHDQIVFKAGSATITMTPGEITIDTPVMLSSVGGPDTILPAMVPTYLPPKGAIAQQVKEQQQPPATPRKLALLKDMPGSDDSISVIVNQINQQSLPKGSTKDYDLDPATQVSGPVSLVCGGTPYTLCNVDQLKFNKDQTAPIYIGKRVKQASPGKQFEQQQDNAYSSEHDNLFMVKAMHTSLAPMNDGAFSLAGLADSGINWLAEQLGSPAKKEAANTAIEASVMAAQNGKFLKDFIHGGKFYIKTVKGTKYIIFKGDPGARGYIKGVRYRADNPKLKILNLVAKPGEQHPASFMKRLANGIEDVGRESRLGIVLVSAEDLLQYYNEPENKRQFSDLVAAIGLDASNYIVSSILAGAIVGFVIALAAPVEITAGVAIGAAFLGLVVAGWINYHLDELEDEFGVKKFIDGMTLECENFLKEYWPEMQAAYDQSANVDNKLEEQDIIPVVRS